MRELPELVLVSFGADAHKDDPMMAHNSKSRPRGYTDWQYHTLFRRLASLRVPVIIVLEGGYSEKSLSGALTSALRGLDQQDVRLYYDRDSCEGHRYAGDAMDSWERCEWAAGAVRSGRVFGPGAYPDADAALLGCDREVGRAWPVAELIPTWALGRVADPEATVQAAVTSLAAAARGARDRRRRVMVGTRLLATTLVSRARGLHPQRAWRRAAQAGVVALTWICIWETARQSCWIRKRSSRPCTCTTGAP